jgi:hypothetical protein
MPGISRLSTLVAALATALGGCSDGDETVLRSHGDDPDGQDPVLVIGECYGKNTDCSGVPKVEPYVPGPKVTCTATHLGTGRLLWSFPRSTPIDCPDPPCTFQNAVIRAAPDGDLDVTATLSSPHAAAPYPVGLWLARFDPRGDLREAKVHEFEIPTRLSEPNHWGPSGYDDLGRAYLTRSVGEPGEIRDVTILRIDRNANSAQELTSVSGVVGTIPVVAPDGSFALHIIFPYDPENLLAELPYRIDVARYDASGRLLWNQPKLSRALALANYGVAGFDADGNLTLHLKLQRTEMFPHPQLPDGSLLQFASQRLARLDPEGNVLWVYETHHSWSVWPAVARDGSVYLLRNSYEQRDDGFYEERAPRLERIDPSGRPDWSLELPGVQADSVATLTLGDDGNLLITARHRATPTVIEYRLISSDGRVCGTFNRPCESDSDCDDQTYSTLLGPDQSAYFSIGRVARP